MLRACKCTVWQTYNHLYLLPIISWIENPRVQLSVVTLIFRKNGSFSLSQSLYRSLSISPSASHTSLITPSLPFILLLPLFHSCNVLSLPLFSSLQALALTIIGFPALGPLFLSRVRSPSFIEWTKRDAYSYMLSLSPSFPLFFPLSLSLPLFLTWDWPIA